MSETVKQALNSATGKLANLDDIEPQIEARTLLSQALNKDSSWLFAWPEYELSETEEKLFSSLLERRIAGEPVSYITGKREFYGLELKVSTHTLIPRPETELLVEKALQLSSTLKAKVLELGTGTGAISTALARQRPEWVITATDIDPDTLAIAQQNFKQHQVSVTPLISDWFEQIPAQEFDLIVSNPPYIEENDPHLSQGDVRFEPRRALVSGNDGLTAIRTILASCPKYLKPGGLVMIEHGYNQKSAVQQLFRLAGLSDIETLCDLAGNDRLTLGKKS